MVCGSVVNNAMTIISLMGMDAVPPVLFKHLSTAITLIYPSVPVVHAVYTVQIALQILSVLFADLLQF